MSFDMRAKPFDLDDNTVRWVNDTFNGMTLEELLDIMTLLYKEE